MALLLKEIPTDWFITIPSIDTSGSLFVLLSTLHRVNEFQFSYHKGLNIKNYYDYYYYYY